MLRQHQGHPGPHEKEGVCGKRDTEVSFQPEHPITSYDFIGTMLIHFEHYRQALRYIIRNLSLPARTRAQAQLQLTDMHCYTRSTQIRNRCIEGGKGRGVLRDFSTLR